MNMTGNTVLISGGGSGIGKALAEMFHAKGNKVIIAGRRQDKLDEVTNANDGMHSLQLDITDSASIDAFVGQVKDIYSDLNVVIHNAGIMRPEKIGDNDIETARATIGTNLFGQIELNSKLLSVIKSNSNAVIMTVTSGLAYMPRSDYPTYCATKAAIHSYTQSLRTQLKPSGVQVIELIPPYVQTELTGPDQATDERALPLTDFITEVTGLLESNNAIREVAVERVKFQRTAESSGEYDERYKVIHERFGMEV